jgi:superfamily II DNA or RNA helicase
MQLRPYQIQGRANIAAAWANGARHVLYVLPTGGGKTTTFAHIAADHDGPVAAVAHRQELVGQIAMAFAREGVRHRLIAPTNVVKNIVRAQTLELGRSFFDPNAHVGVVGVDTLHARAEGVKGWADSVTLWIMDEAHHVLRKNKWGAAVEMFPNARGLGVTATPCRADGNGLSLESDGVFNAMTVGPNMRDLIAAGYLSEYRIFAPPSDLDLSDVTVSAATGDYNPNLLRHAVHRSRIVGDIVDHYQRIAPGRLGVTFATDVESATEIAARFCACGTPAEVVSAKSPDHVRTGALRRFRAREILQLVNVDLFGEGFDLPAIEVASMGRPTKSLALFIQQFGRALRIMPGKNAAIIIDHVGNVMRHGLPDAARVWTMDRRDRARRSSSRTTVKTCMKCFNVYERFNRACPFCGDIPEPAARNAPEFVDGDLNELDAATLERMRGGAALLERTDGEVRDELTARHVPPLGILAGIKRHAEDRAAQVELRETIALWAGKQRAAGRPDSESYRRFYITHAVDVLTAQSLKAADARALAAEVATHEPD